MNATDPSYSDISSEELRLQTCEGINDTVTQPGDPTYTCYEAGKSCQLDMEAVQLCGDNDTCVCGAHRVYLADVTIELIVLI